MTNFSIIFSPEILAATLRSMPPLLLAGLAGIMTKRAGIENIGLEGLMLIGCFSGFIANYLTESWIIGIIGGMLFTTLIALIFGFFVITLRANEIIAGVAINSLGAGLSTYLLRMFFGVKGSFYDPRVQAIPKASFKILHKVPILNTILNNHSIIVWISIILALVVNLLLFYTRFGTYVRAAGEDEDALSTSGINVKKIRYLTIILHGMLCGLGGAYLSTGYLTQFIENMSAGRGFIAMAAIAFSGAQPIRILGATGLFAFVEAIAYRLQSIDIPSYFALMTPYVVTIITLVITSYRQIKSKKGRRLV